MTDGYQLSDLYLQWLYDQTGLPKRGQNRTYWKLFRQMFAKEFVWLVERDASRSEDGKELRWEFVRDAGLEKVEARWLYLPCNMLEFLVGVAKRGAVLTDGRLDDWVRTLLDNTTLINYPDSGFDGHILRIDQMLDALIQRDYKPNGEGGLFPLRYPPIDQRNAEIWTQLNSWLIENE